MAVQMIVGPPGAGKSYVMTAIALDRLKRSNRPVFANYSIEGVEKFKLEDMADLPPCTLIVDEAQNWFHARMWASLQRDHPDLLERWSQTRHMGWDIFLGTQHESNVDSVVRRVCHYGWLLEPRWKVLSSLEPRTRRAARAAGDPVKEHRHPLWVHGRCWWFWDFRRMEKGRRPIRRKTWLWSWDVASAYDTHENVALRRSPGRK